MDMENKFLIMEIIMKENIKMVNLMGEECILGLQANNIKVSS